MKKRRFIGLASSLGVVIGCAVLSPLDEIEPGEPGTAAGGTGNRDGGGSGGDPDASDGSGGDPDASGGSGGGDSGASPCTTNAECGASHADSESRCRQSDGTCVRLKSNDCPGVYGDWRDPDAVYFGALAPLINVMLDSSQPVFNYRMALDELNGAGAGLPAAEPGGRRRPLVMIVCNNHPTAVERALAHLIEDVQVPAVIPHLLPGELLDAFQDHGRPNEVFFLSPVGAVDVLLSDDDEDLLWHVLGQPSDLVPTYAALLERAESRVRGTPGFSGDVKLAVVTAQGEGEAFAEDLGNAFLVDDGVRLNDRSLADEFEAGHFANYTLTGPNVEPIAQQIVQFGPDIVLSLGGANFMSVVVQVETLWGGLAPSGKPRPFTILSPIDTGQLEELDGLMTGLISGASDPTPHDRFVGINVAGNPDREFYFSYLTDLRARFSGAEQEHENFYDAVYYLAYAMAAAGAGPLDGPAISGGMLRLIGGPDAPTLRVRPSNIIEVFQALEDSPTIALEGVTGLPTFDPMTGARVDTGSLYCFNDDLVASFSVQRFDPEAGVFQGNFECFNGF